MQTVLEQMQWGQRLAFWMGSEGSHARDESTTNDASQVDVHSSPANECICGTAEMIYSYPGAPEIDLPYDKCVETGKWGREGCRSAEMVLTRGHFSRLAAI